MIFWFHTGFIIKVSSLAYFPHQKWNLIFFYSVLMAPASCILRPVNFSMETSEAKIYALRDLYSLDNAKKCNANT